MRDESHFPRVISLTARAGAQIGERQNPARAQRAKRLAVKTRLVGNVHDDVLRVGEVEAAGVECLVEILERAK